MQLNKYFQKGTHLEGLVHVRQQFSLKVRHSFLKELAIARKLLSIFELLVK